MFHITFHKNTMFLIVATVVDCCHSISNSIDNCHYHWKLPLTLVILARNGNGTLVIISPPPQCEIPLIHTTRNTEKKIISCCILLFGSCYTWSPFPMNVFIEWSSSYELRQSKDNHNQRTSAIICSPIQSFFQHSHTILKRRNWNATKADKRPHRWWLTRGHWVSSFLRYLLHPIELLLSKIHFWGSLCQLWVKDISPPRCEPFTRSVGYHQSCTLITNGPLFIIFHTFRFW